MDSNSFGIRSLIPVPENVELKSGIIVSHDEVTKVMANLKALYNDPRITSESKCWCFVELEEHCTRRYRDLIFLDYEIPILKELNLIELEDSISQIVAHVIRSAVRTNYELRKVIFENPVRKILSYKDLP